jgi:hypothetical protein
LYAWRIPVPHPPRVSGYFVSHPTLGKLFQRPVFKFNHRGKIWSPGCSWSPGVQLPPPQLALRDWTLPLGDKGHPLEPYLYC